MLCSPLSFKLGIDFVIKSTTFPFRTSTQVQKYLRFICRHSVSQSVHRERDVGKNIDVLLTSYRGENKGMFVLLSRTQAGPGQAEQLSKSRKKFLATTYKHFPGALYIRSFFCAAPCSHRIATPCKLINDWVYATRRAIRPFVHRGWVNDRFALPPLSR